MSENNDMIQIVSNIASERSKDIYDDGFKGATKEVGGALQTVFGLFNNVVLYPLKKANLKFKYNLEEFERDLIKKSENIPQGNLIEPPINILGPTIEGLKYTFEEKELRGMYLNLLTTAMNSETIAYSHPSYAEIIKVMSSLDALIIKQFKRKGNYPISTINFNLDDDRYFSRAFPKLFVEEFINLGDPYLISASLSNLERLGLIKISSGSTIIGFDYESVKQNDYVKNQFERCCKYHSDKTVKMKLNPGSTTLSDFGNNFIDSCVD